jgi:hypothetical protein
MAELSSQFHSIRMLVNEKIGNQVESLADDEIERFGNVDEKFFI